VTASSSSTGALILTSSEVARCLEPARCLEVVGEAFAARGRGAVLGAGARQVPAGPGVFHVRFGGLDGDAARFAVKINGRFPIAAGQERVHGTIVLADARTGERLAIMDAGVLTMVRTAAVATFAAQTFSRPPVGTVVVIGCGVVGSRTAVQLAEVLRPSEVRLWDLDAERVGSLAARLRDEGVTVVTPSHPAVAVVEADLIVTCTPSREALFPADAISPPAVVIAMGADAPGKHELEPELLTRASVFTDVREQSALAGEIAHAIGSGNLAQSDVAGELGDVAVGAVPKPGGLVVFDSTGSAFVDAAVAELVVREAVASRIGRRVDLSA
jgi:ornithine cyclodeaminase/alanine dehydrogenase-like protein (mu-crystallin family)